MRSDSGSAGKKFEQVFAACLRQCGADFTENGLCGSSGKRWDFILHSPLGSLPVGKPFNVKVRRSRNLFTSASLYRALFESPNRMSLTKLTAHAKRLLIAEGLTRIVWVKAPSDEVEARMYRVAHNLGSTDEVVSLFSEWKTLTLPRFDLTLRRVGSFIDLIRILKNGQPFAAINARHNANARCTYASVRLTKP